ncbi:hypothetical protein CEP54_014554 [Fusarium duplospermum]|uniref:Major facilitator superfamily transporter n=1 Tax=Fusarium duplospermum TaxID=1325734 RepID=A0A428NVB7_9HYPO|nr:hypothetical protein CEP54_014554 [Fusarium duplospermum]
MARPVQPPPPEFTTPPGTVRMVREDGRFETSELVLQPTPSSDPNDPLNWSRGRKLANFVPALAITAIIFTQTSLPILFWVLWIPEFGWTYGQLNAASAVNYVGTAVGCILFIPPAVKYGRRSMYILSTSIILAMAVWSACLNSLPELFVSQMLFGLANATNEAIVEMTVADLYFVHQRATANGLSMVMVMTGSFLSQIVAGYMSADDQSLISIAWQSIVILCRLSAVMYTALTYAFTVGWITAQASLISIVFTQPPYNFGTVGVGNMNLGIFVGCILGSIYAALSDRTVIWFAGRNYGYYELEMRLHLNHLPALCLGGGFIMFGVTAIKGCHELPMASLLYQVLMNQGMHWIFPSIGSAIFGFGIGGLGDVALCVLIDSYQAVTGEAFIGVAFIRNCFSIAISFATVPWLDAQGLQNMCIVMGVVAAVTGFLHIPLLRWGKKIRERTAESYEKLVKEREGSHL